MNTRPYTLKPLAVLSALALAGGLSTASAQNTESSGSPGAMQDQPNVGGAGYGHPQSGKQSSAASPGSAGATGTIGAGNMSMSSADAKAETSDTMQQVNNASKIAKEMAADPQLEKLMQQAQGIFLVPQYARGALGIGARGGEGVLVVNNKGQWSNPVFYNYGGVSIGAQAGAEVGAIAMLLMNEKALVNFMQDNNFSLTAGAGLTFLDYSAKAQANMGKGDVILWSSTGGALANASVGVTDINYDEDENRSFYKDKQATAKTIIGGKVKSQQASVLTQALPTGK